jgi:hypothetical protein
MMISVVKEFTSCREPYGKSQAEEFYHGHTAIPPFVVARSVFRDVAISSVLVM